MAEDADARRTGRRPIRDRDGLAAALAEAERCFAAGAPNATALMCRRFMSRLAIAHGADPDRTTGPQLRWLRERGIIGERLYEEAMRVKSLGDEGAHPPDEVTVDEARAALRLSQRIFAALEERDEARDEGGEAQDET